MSKLAAEAGVNRENLYRMLSEREQPRRPESPYYGSGWVRPP